MTAALSMAVRNVIFDFGGVLVTWRPQEIIESFYSDPALREAVRVHAFQHADWLEMDRGTLDEPTVVRRFAARMGRPEAELRALFDHVRAALVPIEPTVALLHELRHYPESTIGWLMSARGFGNFVSFGVVVWATQYNARLALAVGLLLQAVAVWQMTTFNINVSDFDIYWTNFVQGFGFGLAYTPMTVLAFSTLPAPLVVQGSAVFNQLRNFGSSLFISLSILVLVRSTAENYAGLPIDA